MIGPLGRWVLEEACRQAAWWQARYPRTPPLTLGVNLSAGTHVLRLAFDANATSGYAAGVNSLRVAAS